MHAARAMNAQRKRREEKLQAQQRRASSAISGRSASRSPVPSMDIEAGGKKRKKSKSTRIDLAYVGFVLAIFGAVPLLVGTFVDVPWLWETGLAITLFGLFLGLIFWCCDFCRGQKTPSKPNPFPDDSKSRTPRRAHKGKVEDISTLKPQDSSFKNGSTLSSKRPTPSPSPAHVTPMTPVPPNSNNPNKEGDVFLTRTETISEIKSQTKPITKSEISRGSRVLGSASAISDPHRMPDGVTLVRPNTSNYVPNNPTPFRSFDRNSSSFAAPLVPLANASRGHFNTTDPKHTDQVDSFPCQINDDAVEIVPSEIFEDEDVLISERETTLDVPESGPGPEVDHEVDDDQADNVIDNPVDLEVENIMQSSIDPLDLENGQQDSEELEAEEELETKPIEISQTEEIDNPTPDVDELAENIKVIENIDVVENFDSQSPPLDIDEAIAEITSSPQPTDDEDKVPENPDEVTNADNVDEVTNADNVDEVTNADNVDEVTNADNVDDVINADNIDEIPDATTNVDEIPDITNQNVEEIPATNNVDEITDTKDEIMVVETSTESNDPPTSLPLNSTESETLISEQTTENLLQDLEKN